VDAFAGHENDLNTVCLPRGSLVAHLAVDQRRGSAPSYAGTSSATASAAKAANARACVAADQTAGHAVVLRLCRPCNKCLRDSYRPSLLPKTSAEQPSNDGAKELSW
jgi:hypothetical protein